MKKFIYKILCKIGFHTHGYPHGLDNGGFHGIRVEFYTCSICGKKQYKVIEVDYR